jgi:hypothetical protein
VDANDAEAVRRIERDRKRREDELMLLLLLLLGGTSTDLIVALRHGFDSRAVLARRLGDTAVEIIAERMADAHADAFMRFGRQYEPGINRSNAGPRGEVIERYRPQARDMAQAIAVNLYRSIVEQSRATPPADVTPAVARSWDSPTAVVRRAFDQCGYGRANPFNLAAGIERNIVLASNVGMFNVVTTRTAVTLGIRHVSIVDAATTDICLDRHGLVLPADHEYWRSGHAIPPLHPRCRSVLLPVKPPFEADTVLPTVPAAPGWGAMPQGFIDELLRAA